MTKAGDGERIAMLGYVPQYQLAAKFVYEALLGGKLEWFKVADPEAKTLDDIQISTTECIYAYQVKWSEYVKDEFSFNDFIRDEKNKESLFKQLVSGWVAIRKTNPDRRVIVHLLHRQVPSANPSAKVPSKDTNSSDNHFQKFLKECWVDRAWAETSIESAPENWQPAILKLKQISGLDEDQFLNFVLVCNLEFNYKIERNNALASPSINRESKDKDQIYKLILEMAGGEVKKIKCDRNQLLTKLSWIHRFQHKFVHEFPIINSYEPISQTINELNDHLSRQKKGYLALLGPPGSGKSTTLTETLKYTNDHRIVRYYAYVPDSPFQARGEANSFLNDITMSLKNHGFYGGTNRSAQSRSELLGLLGEQFVEANLQWEIDGIVTAILIDGLDHIQREQSPQHSLLQDLPHPGSIPDGVIIILGSQTLQLHGLSDAIKIHIEHQNRQVTISPLNRQESFNVINRWPINRVVSTDETTAIFEKSSGHPLSLAYILQIISEDGSGDIINLLENLPDYQGDIEENYKIYWRGVEGDSDVKDLLGMLARIRMTIDMTEVEKWTSFTVIKRFVNSASHYFRKDTSSRWSFFHNSFRIFILKETGKSYFSDGVVDIDFHNRLARLCARTTKDSPLYWEQIYHLYKSNNHKEIIEMATQDFFRNQFFKFRHIENIIEDLNCFILSARKESNPLAVFRAILIEHEIRERDYSVEQAELPRLLLKTQGVQAAWGYICEGNKLRISEASALQFCSLLIKAGHIEEAKTLFHLAEPLDLLSGHAGIGGQHDDMQAIKYWISSSAHLMPLEKVIVIIHQTRCDESLKVNFSNNSDLHQSLVKALIRSLAESNSSEKMSELFNFFKGKVQYYERLIDLCFSICFNDKIDALSVPALEIILEWEKSSESSDDDKVMIAELSYKISNNKELAHSLIEGVSQPELYKHGNSSGWKELGPFSNRIRLNRLLSALGKEEEPENAVKNTKRKECNGNVLFERSVVKFANFWGRGWKGEKISPQDVNKAIKPVLNLLHRDHSQTHDWIGWYEIKATAPDFYKFAIKCVAPHGEECLRELYHCITSHWDSTYWPASWRRKVALEFFIYNNDYAELVVNLSKAEEDALAESDVYSRLSELTEFAIAWSDIGEIDKSRSLLNSIIMNSYGISSDKDNQFHIWCCWLGALIENGVPDSTAYEQLCNFVNAYLRIERSGKGSGISEAGIELIAACTKWNMEYSFSFTRWLINTGGVSYTTALKGILTGLLARGSPSLQSITSVAAKLLIPLAGYSQSDLPQKFSEVLHTSISNKPLIINLINSINTNSFPIDRKDWLDGIIKGAKIAGNVDPMYSDLSRRSPEKRYANKEVALTLNTGEELTNDEAILKISSVTELMSFLSSIETVQYFRWTDLISPFLNHLTVDQIEIVCESLSRLDGRIDAQAKLANELASRGESEKSSMMLKGLLTQASPNGWDRFWDGGSKLSIYKALVKIDPDQWRVKALNSFVDDYIGEHRSPRNFIHQLDDLATVFFESDNVVDIWGEISDHFYQLDDFSEVEFTPPLLIHAEPLVSDTHYLLKYAFISLDYIIPEVALMAHQAIVEIAKNSLELDVIQEEITLRLSKVGLVQIKSLALLKSIVKFNAPFVGKFSETIVTTCSSKNLTVRIMAYELATAAGITIDEHDLSTSQKLPFLYGMELPEINSREDALPFSAMKPGDVLPDFDDPLELIKPLDREVDLLSRMSNIPFQNILARAVGLMKSLVPEEEWNKASEEKIRNQMEGMDLKLTYHRLRPQVARLALSHVACELIDCGCIDGEDFLVLKKTFKRADTSTLDRIPTQKPEFIFIPGPEGEKDFWKHEEWSSKASSALGHLNDRTTDHMFILGEITKWRYLDWKRPTEIRMSTIGHKAWSQEETPEDPSSFFPWRGYWSADEYPKFNSIHKPSLVIYGSPDSIDHGGTSWLAFNPGIAFQLGWNMSPQGLFRWENSSGDIMVESLFWKDGPIEREPPKFEICSNGWLVIASKEAVDKILEFMGDSALKIDIVNRNYGDNPYQLHSMSAESRSIWPQASSD